MQTNIEVKNPFIAFSTGFSVFAEKSFTFVCKYGWCRFIGKTLCRSGPNLLHTDSTLSMSHLRESNNVLKLCLLSLVNVGTTFSLDIITYFTSMRWGRALANSTRNSATSPIICIFWSFSTFI